MKRAYDRGLLDKKWIEEYCWKGGQGCVRKRRFEEEGYVSPDYVLPDGTVDERLGRRQVADPATAWLHSKGRGASWRDGYVG
jgi:hypothetical protein